MEAREVAFYFMQAGMCVEVPFFQRGYVWSEENWEELIENLLDSKQNHFLGSIILKQRVVRTGEVPKCYVIDGQQRLTTLSILLRACYDSLPLSTYKPEIQNQATAILEQILFFKKKPLSPEKEVKIKHSRLDSTDYEKVINGEMKREIDNIILKSETKNGKGESSNILQCYKYFMKYLDGKKVECEKLWELLISENDRVIVKIDLGAEENEQAIFDTVNAAGVRLTCSDTIKNALFQKANENSSSLKEKEEIIQLYTNSWEKMFEGSSNNVEFWSLKRRLGRLERDNQEILLHCIALIKQFYNPEENKIADLSQVYKKYIDDFDNVKLFDFIKEIIEYAEIYRDNFIGFNKSSYFNYEDDLQRLFHILDVCEISTFHPYILKLFKDYGVKVNGQYQQNFLDQIKLIEKYVLRHYVCGATTKNFNKECALLIKGKTTMIKLLNDKSNAIGDQIIKLSLQQVSKNKIATLILFWMELKRKNDDPKTQSKEMKYVYSLEHIMPQKWQEHWGVDVLPVKDINTHQVIKDLEKAKANRQSAVYKIGNMTLLTTSLNSSLKNFEFEHKINGQGKKKGISHYAELGIAKEIVEIHNSKKTWDEIEIENRTNKLTEEFLKIW